MPGFRRMRPTNRRCPCKFAELRLTRGYFIQVCEHQRGSSIRQPPVAKRCRRLQISQWGALVGELSGFRRSDRPLFRYPRKHLDRERRQPDTGTATFLNTVMAGANPLQCLNTQTNAPQACSVDFITGNLAVADVPVGIKPNIAVYSNAHGTPKYYSTAGIANDLQTIPTARPATSFLPIPGGLIGWLPWGSPHTTKFMLSPAPERVSAMRWDESRTRGAHH